MMTFITATGSRFVVSHSEKNHTISYYPISSRPKENAEDSACVVKPRVFVLSTEEFEGLRDLLKLL